VRAACPAKHSAGWLSSTTSCVRTWNAEGIL